MESEHLHIDVHFHNHETQEVQETIKLLKALIKQGVTIMSTLTNLSDAVAANTTVAESAITLLEGLKAKLDEAIASGDPAQVQALSDALAAETQKLADAVSANTPAA